MFFCKLPQVGAAHAAVAMQGYNGGPYYYGGQAAPQQSAQSNQVDVSGATQMVPAAHNVYGQYPQHWQQQQQVQQQFQHQQQDNASSFSQQPQQAAGVWVSPQYQPLQHQGMVQQGMHPQQQQQQQQQQQAPGMAQQQQAFVHLGYATAMQPQTLMQPPMQPKPALGSGDAAWAQHPARHPAMQPFLPAEALHASQQQQQPFSSASVTPPPDLSAWHSSAPPQQQAAVVVVPEPVTWHPSQQYMVAPEQQNAWQHPTEEAGETAPPPLPPSQHSSFMVPDQQGTAGPPLPLPSGAISGGSGGGGGTIAHIKAQIAMKRQLMAEAAAAAGGAQLQLQQHSSAPSLSQEVDEHQAMDLQEWRQRKAAAAIGCSTHSAAPAASGGDITAAAAAFAPVGALHWGGGPGASGFRNGPATSAASCNEAPPPPPQQQQPQYQPPNQQPSQSPKKQWPSQSPNQQLKKQRPSQQLNQQLNQRRKSLQQKKRRPSQPLNRLHRRKLTALLHRQLPGLFQQRHHALNKRKVVVA